MRTLILGDESDPLELTAYGRDGAVADLTGYSTIDLHWVKPNGSESWVSVTVVSQVLGRVKYEWEPGDVAPVGYHKGRIVVDRNTPTQKHYPDDGSWFWWLVSG